MLSSYKNKTVLVTGHTGFKGSWLCAWLNSLGANVVGLSNSVPTTPSNFSVSGIGSKIEDVRVDICNKKKVKEVLDSYQPDFVFHLAAQALVRPSYDEPVDTMITNAIGTANVLDALRGAKKKVVAIMITSDKAYDNVEWVWGYRETDLIGGKDPYSASKGMAELAIRSYVESFFRDESSNVAIGIARAGNVIGGGDWAKDRIVPDCMEAWAAGSIVDIRSPNATRPWQHVLEPLSGYLTLGVELSRSKTFHGEAFNFGPAAHNNQTVQDLIESMSNYWGNVKWSDTSSEYDGVYEAGLLRLNCDKALLNLGWVPSLEFEDTVRMTVQWYRDFYQSENISELTNKQIKEYTDIATNKGLVWAS